MLATMFGDHDDDGGRGGGGGGGDAGFTINKEFAQRFEERARRRALWEAKQRGLLEVCHAVSTIA